MTEIPMTAMTMTEPNMTDLRTTALPTTDRTMQVAGGQLVAVAESATSARTHEPMCFGKTELFFAPPGERDGRRRKREELARAYCSCCQLLQLCKAIGRAGREHGIWGGENDEQRAAAGFGSASPHRRAVAHAAREARKNGVMTGDIHFDTQNGHGACLNIDDGDDGDGERGANRGGDFGAEAHSSPRKDAA